jgi:predicted DNA-binding antitoxin AbrB/MazE fold protein
MVSRILEAAYENGVLKPMKPRSLAEHENVRLGLLANSDEETSSLSSEVVHRARNGSGELILGSGTVAVISCQRGLDVIQFTVV